MRRRTGLALVVCVLIGPAVEAQTLQPAQNGEHMMNQARGTFDVEVKPLPADEKVPGLAVGRMSAIKKWQGDLEGTSKGEMMTAGAGAEGSGGYVAVEQVQCTLKGRSGSFTLVHQGTMRRGGEFNMVIRIVPDSGTGQLEGIAGSLKIIIENGKHSYELDYTLP